MRYFRKMFVVQFDKHGPWYVATEDMFDPAAEMDALAEAMCDREETVLELWPSGAVEPVQTTITEFSFCSCGRVVVFQEWVWNRAKQDWSKGARYMRKETLRFGPPITLN